jgi:hypothetical protein
MRRSTLFIAIAAVLILVVILVIMSLKIAPRFSMALLSLILTVVSFMFTEQSFTHDANEYENRFWTLTALFLAIVVLFIEDSPLYFQLHNGIKWFAVGSFTFWAHNYDRHVRRFALIKARTMKKVVNASEGCNEANHKVLAEVTRLLSGIDNAWFSSTFQNLFMLPRVLYIESQIVNIFSEASSEELNYVVSNAEMGLLLYKMKDHRIARKYNRTSLLEILAKTRVTELTTLSRVMLLDGIQRMKLSAHANSENYVKNIILKTSGDDLSDLKSISDSKGDFNSMHKLIYADIKDASIRKDILAHISAQGKVQRIHMTLGTGISKRRRLLAWRKILSDVDDTLSCSGGSYPAGIDTSYPRKTVYPGVLSFYRELDLGAGNFGPDAWDDSKVGNLVFLSARPHVYKDTSERHSYEKFTILQENRGMHTSPSLLAGSLETGGKFIMNDNNEFLAQKKHQNFVEYMSL